MSIPELIAEWPAIEIFFDTRGNAWESEVAAWPIPWRRMWARISLALRDEGLALHEAERRAYEQVLESRRNPRRTAGQLVGGGRAVRDAVARPRMVSKKVTKKDRRVARESGGGLFDGLEDGNERSSTYQMENQS